MPMPVVLLLSSFVFGLLLALVGAPGPWGALGVLAVVPLAGLLGVVAQARAPGVAAARAFVGGLGFFVPTLLWLPQSFGAGLGWFGAVMFLPLYALLAGFWAALAVVVGLVGRSARARLWLLAAGWVLVEWLRSLGPLAFPWGTVGYALTDLPVAQVADLGGVLLLSLLVTTSAAALVSLARADVRPVALVAVAWLAGSVYGVTRSAPSGEAGRALLLRTDTNSFDKAGATASALNEALVKQLRLSSVADPDEVVVWSETAVFALPDFDQRGLLPARPMITGMRFPERNSAVSWDGRVRSTYDKMHPVPFGEFFPLLDSARPVYDAAFRLLGLPLLEGTRAGVVAEPLALRGRLYGTYICYDSVIPSVTRALAARGAGVLVNVSNDGYYGSSAGVEQHFQMGRLRAIETRRFVLRSVNDGIAAVIDPRGRVTQRFSGPGSEALSARFAYLSGVTPYVRFGDVPVVALTLALAGVVVWRERRAARVLP